MFDLPMFDPVVWGTVGQWASAIGTTAAFTATFYVIRRDAKVRRYAQARKVAFYVDRVERDPNQVEGKRKRWYDATIKNLSDEPIYDVRFYMLRASKRVDGLGWEDVLLPGQAAVHRSGTACSTSQSTWSFATTPASGGTARSTGTCRSSDTNTGSCRRRRTAKGMREAQRLPLRTSRA